MTQDYHCCVTYVQLKLTLELRLWTSLKFCIETTECEAFFPWNVLESAHPNCAASRVLAGITVEQGLQHKQGNPWVLLLYKCNLEAERRCCAYIHTCTQVCILCFYRFKVVHVCAYVCDMLVYVWFPFFSRYKCVPVQFRMRTW